MLPASRSRAAADCGGGEPADRLDAGPGGQHARNRRERGVPQQHARLRGCAGCPAAGGSGRVAAALCIAGTHRPGEHAGVAEAGAAGLLRHRRSPLYFGMGARVPPGIPPTGNSAGALSGGAHRGLYRQRDARGAARYPGAVGAARSGPLGKQLLPPQSALRGARMRAAAAGFVARCGARLVSRRQRDPVRADHQGGGVDRRAAGETGVPIVPYHGKMDAALRQKNQELWMSGKNGCWWEPWRSAWGSINRQPAR